MLIAHSCGLPNWSLASLEHNLGRYSFLLMLLFDGWWDHGVWCGGGLKVNNDFMRKVWRWRFFLRPSPDKILNPQSERRRPFTKKWTWQSFMTSSISYPKKNDQMLCYENSFVNVYCINYGAQGARKLKKFRPKKLVKSNKLISRNFFYQIPFFAISKMAKSQFLNWEKV